MTRAIKIGDRFNMNYADSCPEWTVTGKRGRGVFEAKITDGPDFLGTKKVFTVEEIRQAMALGDFFDKVADLGKKFYASLVPGQTVHYHSGFGEFVRCTVQEDKNLRPSALVGNWSRWDLKADGDFPRMIAEGESFHPNAANIYENPHFDRREGDRAVADPRVMEPVKIAPPPPSTPCTSSMGLPRCSPCNSDARC